MTAAARYRRPAPAPRTMAELYAAAAKAPALPQMVDLFAATVAPRGFTHHLCVIEDEWNGTQILFGDTTRIDADGHHIVHAEAWGGQPVQIWLGGRTDKRVDRDEHAALQGLAQVYVTLGMALLEQARDLPTECGLGIEQRRCLAALLTGMNDGDIAETTGLSPLAVRGHIENACRLLGASTRVEAIAIAARRGWLALPLWGERAKIVLN